MAPHRLVSLVGKRQRLEDDLHEMENVLTSLLNVVTVMGKKQMGRRFDLARDILPDDNINALLQSSQHVDDLLLKIQNLLNRCTAYSNFLQHLLMLRSCHKCL